MRRSTDHRPPRLARPLRLLLVAHGYPPAERAGTEQHAAAVSRALRARGHEVQVLAATRDPARRQYEVVREVDEGGVVVHRVVQNLPTRALAQGERDRAVEEIARRIHDALLPDLVHVHHLQFLSSGLTFPCPVVYSLHDQWTWCAAGGLGLLPGGAPCPGPSPDRCAPCAAAWAPRPGPGAAAALALAGRLAPVVPPAHLHRALRLLPAPLRRHLQAPRRGAALEPVAAASGRNAALAAFGRAATLRLCPSRHLAALAEAQGLGPVEVLPHGVPLPARRPAPATRAGPLLFLGTIAAHKGPDLVVRAWRRAFPGGDPPLVLHGPVQDASLSLGHPLAGPLDREGVAAALAEARALVIGSTWPENQPLVALEARAAGCPVLAPAIGGLPEIVVEGRDGWLYPPGDEAALARLLQRAVRAPLPTSPAPPPDLDAHVDALLDLYDRALAGARGRAG